MKWQKKYYEIRLIFCGAFDYTPYFSHRKIKRASNHSLYILEAAKFVKKYPEKFSKNSEHPDANIRVTRNLTCNENDLFVKPCRNLNFVQNPLIMLARIWNHLTETIKSIEDTKLFVKKLKVILFNYMFYDMHEFFSCKFN